MANRILLSEITTPDKAKELFVNRRSETAQASAAFLSGDHWQSGSGYIGPKPLSGTGGWSQLIAQIKEAFVSENVIAEVVDRRRSGVLGREPLWGFLPDDVPSPQVEQRRKLFSKLVQGVKAAVKAIAGTSNVGQEADDALTTWWNNRKVRKALKKALDIALSEERATLRFFIPSGLTEDGEIDTQKDLTTALTFAHLEVLTSDKAGIFVDDATQEEFGVYIFKTEDDKDAAELTFVEEGITIRRDLRDKEDPQDFSFNLGGRLLMFELQHDLMITEQVQSAQKSLNLALTMMMRNVNLAGSLERWITNAARPMESVRVPDNSAKGWHDEIREAGELPVGGGVTNYLAGMLVRNDAGEVIGRANPNISFRDPVAIDTFTGTRDQFYVSILGQCQQRHALISGDAVASGKSRLQARGEFRGSLLDSKEVVDDAGRWTLETGLRLGAELCGKSKQFLGLRCDFNVIIEDGPVDPDERKENRADVQAGLMSEETAMSRNGIDDTDAELERIRQEAVERAKNAPPIQPPISPPQGNQPPPSE